MLPGPNVILHYHNEFDSGTSALHDTPVDQEVGLTKPGTTCKTTGLRSAAICPTNKPDLPYSMVLTVQEHINPHTL